MNAKHFVLLGIIIIAALGVSYKLHANKRQFQENIEFAQKTIDKIPVSAENVKKDILSENVIASGTLEPVEILNLVSETQGKIVKIMKRKGSSVEAGDIIAKVDDEVISANVLTAEANYTQNQKDVERLTRLAEENAITKRDLEQATIGLKKAKADLITAQRSFSNTSIKSPIAGFINSDNITLGQFVGPGVPVCEIVNNQSLKLNIRVSEKEVYKISRGQKVNVSVSVFPDLKFIGTVSTIAEKADAAMKFNVEITLANNRINHLRSGLYAEVELPVKNEPKILIKKECIIGSMENPVIFVAENGKAFKRSIITGQSNDKQVEVLSGLSANEKIIVNGQLNLKDGDEITIVN